MSGWKSQGRSLRYKRGAKAALEDPAPGASAWWWKVVSLKTLWPGPLGTYAKFLNGVGEITSRLYFGDLVWEITLFKVGRKCFNHCMWGTASRRVAAKPTAITIATVALEGETWQQEEALVVECVLAEGGGAQGWGHSQCQDQRRHELAMAMTEAHELLQSPPNGEERSG